MLLRSFLSILDSITPLHLAEPWDNVGFQIGDPNQEVVKALMCLEVTPASFQEALDKGVEMILAHHPLIFHPLKQVLRKGNTSLVYQLIEHRIHLYVAHTNLDVITGGVAHRLAELLQLKDLEPLVPTEEEYLNFFFWVDPKEVSALNQVEKKGETLGIHDWRKIQDMDSRILVKATILKEKWNYFEKICLSYGFYLNIINRVKKKSQFIGLGRMGVLEKSITGQELIQKLKKILPIHQLRYVGDPRKKVNKIALLPGSGGAYWEVAHQKGAHVFITGDIKHHMALECENKGLFLIDPGHYGSEAIVLESWAAMIQKACRDVKIEISKLSTDPFCFA